MRSAIAAASLEIRIFAAARRKEGHSELSQRRAAPLDQKRRDFMSRFFARIGIKGAPINLLLVLLYALMISSTMGLTSAHRRDVTHCQR